MNEMERMFDPIFQLFIDLIGTVYRYDMRETMRRGLKIFGYNRRTIRMIKKKFYFEMITFYLNSKKCGNCFKKNNIWRNCLFFILTQFLYDRNNFFVNLF